MATCPSCEAPDLEVDEYELEEGEIITCPECGTSLEVTGLAPVEFDIVSDDDEDDAARRTCRAGLARRRGRGAAATWPCARPNVATGPTG
jgi:alpha-aminoadipate carrier protein LysW